MHALQDPVFLRKLGICFLIALASYAFVHGFELTHFTLSIDEEPLDNFGQTLSAGRWGHALLKRHLLPEPYLPFLTMALSLILLSMSAALSAVHLRLDTLRSAAFVVMLAALPQLAFQLEFANQADTVALSLLCSAASVLVLRRPGAAGAVVFVGLTVVSLSIYQSIFLYAASLICIGLAIEAAEGGFSTAAAVRLVLRFAVLTAVALVLNSMLARSVAGHYGVAISSYLSSMVGWGKAPPTDVVRSVWLFARDYLSFRAPFGLNAFAFSALWAAGAVACSFRLRLGALRVAVLCLATLGSAFLLTLVLGVGLPPRTMTQVPLVFAGLFATFVVAARWRLLALPVAAVFLVSGAAGSTRLFYSDHMARVADRQLAGEIVAAIYARYPSFDVARTPVFFYGSHRPHNAWRLPDSDVFGASFFEWDGGNNSRMYRYLSVANIIDLKIPDAAQVKTAIEDARGLRAWPDRGAVQMSHDVVIVKLGDVLSPYNK